MDEKNANYIAAAHSCLPLVPPHVADYIRAHVLDPNAASDHARTCEIYRPFVKGTVLDWGAAHAPDALFCSKGHTVEACDVLPPEWFRAMHYAAGARYTRLTHPFELPYGNSLFGTVISHGTLEHVPLESRSLDEVWRVLQIGGIFIIACMPQMFSAVEWINKSIGRPHHKRRHTRASLRRLMLAHGFIPLLMRAHHSRPMALRGLAAKLWPSWMERIPVIRGFTQNLLCVAVKVHAIGAEIFDIESAK